MSLELVCALDQERVKRRSEFMLDTAHKLIASPAFARRNFVLNEAVFDGLAAYYFLTSNAYKKNRVADGHKTRPSKIAAISCTAVSVILPIRPHSGIMEEMEDLYVNPALAMRLGVSIVDHPFHLRSFDDQRRFYQSIIDMKFGFAREYAQEFQRGVVDFSKDYTVCLERSDRAIIDMKVNMFEVLAELKIVK